MEQPRGNNGCYDDREGDASSPWRRRCLPAARARWQRGAPPGLPGSGQGGTEGHRGAQPPPPGALPPHLSSSDTIVFLLR